MHICKIFLIIILLGKMNSTLNGRQIVPYAVASTPCNSSWDLNSMKLSQTNISLAPRQCAENVRFVFCACLIRNSHAQPRCQVCVHVAIWYLPDLARWSLGNYEFELGANIFINSILWTSFNRMAWQWAETLLEIRVTLADIRGTTK